MIRNLFLNLPLFIISLFLFLGSANAFQNFQVIELEIIDQINRGEIEEVFENQNNQINPEVFAEGFGDQQIVVVDYATLCLINEEQSIDCFYATFDAADDGVSNLTNQELLDRRIILHRRIEGQYRSIQSLKGPSFNNLCYVDINNRAGCKTFDTRRRNGVPNFDVLDGYQVPNLSFLKITQPSYRKYNYNDWDDNNNIHASVQCGLDVQHKIHCWIANYRSIPSLLLYRGVSDYELEEGEHYVDINLSSFSRHIGWPEDIYMCGLTNLGHSHCWKFYDDVDNFSFIRNSFKKIEFPELIDSENKIYQQTSQALHAFGEPINCSLDKNHQVQCYIFENFYSDNDDYFISVLESNFQRIGKDLSFESAIINLKDKFSYFTRNRNALICGIGINQNMIGCSTDLIDHLDEIDGSPNNLDLERYPTMDRPLVNQVPFIGIDSKRSFTCALDSNRVAQCFGDARVDSLNRVMGFIRDRD